MLFVISCASKPSTPAAAGVAAPAAPAAPAAAAPATPRPALGLSQGDLDKLLARAKDLKMKAFDLKLFEVLPDDYKSADAALAAGQTSYDAQDQTAARASLDKAVSLFQDLIARGVVQLAAEKRKGADDMKAAALKEGADTKAPDRFGPAEAAYAEAAALVDAGKYEEAIGDFDLARVEYEIAYKKSLADDLRGTIRDGDYAKWDTGNFQIAETRYASEYGLWARGTEADRAADLDALDEAILRYNLVIQKGMESVAEGEKAKTDEAKARSDAIKANVAVKDLYDAAQLGYNDAMAKLASGDYEAATKLFDDATSRFDTAYQEAAKERAAAEAALQAADQAVVESQKAAHSAESLVTGSAAQ
jgi:hypothetical protein